MSTVAHAPAGERSPVRVAFLAVLLLAGGLAVFVLGSPYFDIWPTNDNSVFNAVLALGFGLVALIMRRKADTARYVPAVYALFVAATANLVLVFGPLNSFVSEPAEPYRLIAQDKVLQLVYVVPVILILNGIARRNLGYVFLQRGRPRRWLAFGLVSFAVCAVGVTAATLASGVTVAALAAAAPYVLVFVVANAVMEELWFRGIFLRPYSVDLGRWGAVVVTALVFAASHVNVTYLEAGMGLPFGLAVLAIGLATAWAMRWADSLWGAVLFHMGMDLLIILPIVQSL